jgi:hypothetical protein
MGASEFGRVFDRAIRDRGLSQARVGVMVGMLPDGRILNEKAVERIREGGRRLDHVLVARLIEVMDLDEAEAWAAAGLWPPDLDLESYRELRRTAPRQPALAHAVGGGGTPPASSLRPVHRAFSQQGDATTGTLTVLAAWRRSSKSARIGQVAA